MGAQVEKPESLDLSEHAPPLQQYHLGHCGPNYYVWDHTMQQQSLIQFPINLPNQIILKQQIQMYLLRHRHHLLVSSMFFRRNVNTGKASVFYERVFTNLSRIKDIPFEDTLQFYYVSLKGFQLLFKRFGFFEVEQNMFHITKSKKIKVWCNKDIQKSKPKQPQPGMVKGTQGDMVKKIIRIIQQNSDNSGSNFPIGPIIYQEGSSNFSQAIQKLRDICRKQRYIIPERLLCLDIICKGDVGILLDQYGQIKQNPNFFDVKEDIKLQPLNLNFQQRNNNKPIQEFRIYPSNAPFELKNRNENSLNHNQNSISKINRKHKGLKISHSLEKPNQNQISHVIIQKPISNFQVQSPIKSLNHPQLTNNVTAPQQFNGIHLNQIIRQPSYNYQSQTRIIPKSPQNQFTNVFIPTSPVNPNCRPSTPLLNRPGSMIRVNSIDNLNVSRQNINRPQQYRVVVNYAHPNQIQPQKLIRPPSVPSIPPPFPYQYQQLSPNLLPKRPTNNFLNVYPPAPPTQKNSQIQNQNKTSPNFYKKPQRNSDYSDLSTENKPNDNGSANYRNSFEFDEYKPSQDKKIQKKYQFQPGNTIINNLLDLKTNEFNKTQPLSDYSNFKHKFQQFKKSFDFKKPENKQQISKYGPHKSFDQQYGQQNLYQYRIPKTNPNKPFFAGILKTQTVNSYAQNIQQNRPEKRLEQKLETLQSKRSKYDGPNEFPTVTDISDNTSYYPSRQKVGETGNIWREESLVIKHDPNESKIKMPEFKKYQPKIDQQIWADMMKARNKLKQVA